MDYVETFYDKYKNIGNRWNIPKDDAMRAVNKGTNALIRELQLNKAMPLKLPAYFKDIRNDDRYIYDIIEGWVAQKMIRCWLYYRAIAIDNGATVVKNGSDSDWVVVRDKAIRITSKQDLLVTTSTGIKTPVEVQTCRRSNQKKYHIKKYKAHSAIKNGGIFVFVNLQDDWYFIVDPANDLTPDVPVVYNGAYGGKECYEFNLYKIQELGMHKMSDLMPNKLKTLLGLPKRSYYGFRDNKGRFVARKAVVNNTVSTMNKNFVAF